jgi:FecR protein
VKPRTLILLALLGVLSIFILVRIVKHASRTADEERKNTHPQASATKTREGTLGMTEIPSHTTLGKTKPQLGGPQSAIAGKVTSAMPDEVVQHQGDGREIALKLNESVNWEDVIRTLRAGRVRIGLLDGSFLNIGVRSVMRITKHDAQTQQTQLELTVGDMRGEVIKLSRPAARFEVQTPTAVIGVVGTTFLVRALPGRTEVYCIQGLVAARNIDPAIVGEITLHQGEFTTVIRGRVPTKPALASGTQIQDEMNLTEMGPSENRPHNLPDNRVPQAASLRAARPSAPPLQVLFFEMRPKFQAHITPGAERASLCYGVVNAARVQIDPDIGEVPASAENCVAIMPRDTTIYTLTATGAEGQVATSTFMVSVVRK